MANEIKFPLIYSAERIRQQYFTHAHDFNVFHRVEPYAMSEWFTFYGCVLQCKTAVLTIHLVSC